MDSWKEFRETGLLVFVNCFLHIFGWAICLDVEEDGSVKAAYPKKVNFSGFPEVTMDLAYERVKKLVKGNDIEEEEVIDEDEEESTKENMLKAKSLNEDAAEIIKIVDKIKLAQIANEKLDGERNR